MPDISQFKLIIEDDEGHRNVVPVDLGDITIGRHDGNTIRLNERNVSRRHVRLFRDGSAIYAEDLDSYNGVFLNGDRISGRQEVHEGDLLRVGDFQLEVRGEGLVRRTEETTQRTMLVNSESTQPRIHLSGPAQESSAGRSSAAREAEAETEPVHEATAIIRMDQIAEMGATRQPGKAALADQVAKLVCVSTQFAGRQFEVTKTEMVIGRTEDNDIQIDHRSVSRHHAKIATNGRSCKVIDLNSANGTLVNGEEYAQVDLKNGDLIELGHVKLRFVPPGQNYRFSEEELAAMRGAGGRVPTPPTGVPASLADQARAVAGLWRYLQANPSLMLVAAGLVLVLVVGAIWLAGSGDERPSGAAPRGGSELEVAPQRSAQPGTTGRAATGSDAEKLLVQAEQALAQRRWTQAAALANAALALEPNLARAKEIALQAQLETTAQSAYDAAVAAIGAEKWSEAWNRLSDIPATSNHYGQARALIDQVRAALVMEKVKAAEEAIGNGNLSHAEERVSEIASLDPGRADIARLRAALQEARKKGEPASRPNAAKASAHRAAPATPPPAPKPKAPVDDAKTAYDEGIQSLSRGQYDEAINALNRCVKIDASYAQCYRAMGIAYARAGNGPKAYRYYKQYLKVEPNAPDAEKVRALLQQYEQTQGQGP